MSSVPTALWLSVSPALHRFNHPLISRLSQQHNLAVWEYEQTPDEAITLDVALVLLHDYCKQLDHPVHLIGHGLSGWLGMIYAQRYPERVNSLTLLSVGANLGIDWQSYYYALLKSLPCDRHTILTQIVYSLFGRQCPFKTELFIYLLEQDLLSSPSPNTLMKQLSVTPEVISVPLFVLGSKDDMVISSYQLNAWESWLKSGDVLWKCNEGKHFFHYMKPQEVSDKIALFWGSISTAPKTNDSYVLSRCPKS